ncbi:MAG: PIG-L family deacetylase [Planctomycetia bacterium]|nr:PIG-L family deacetylase [Planctomycetia bacterium]
MNSKTGIMYDRRVGNQVFHADSAKEIFPDWQNEKESWLFLAPHDDDIVCGAGLTFLAALAEGISTHAVITTNGLMGYCRPEQRNTIADIRRRETTASFTAMGLPSENLHRLEFDDCSLYRKSGRQFMEGGDPTIIGSAMGLQNSFTWVLRKIRPTRVFLPTSTDIHPDHKLTTSEMIISIFHAQGGIWPELGPALEQIPRLYEYATYSDFITPPTLRVRTSEELLEKKLAGIMEYKSQEQIELLIEVQRKAGAQEYIREVEFDIMQPGKYDYLFDM